MYTNGDVLGEEGRKALDACVKVKIYGAESTRRYNRYAAFARLQDCYAGRFPQGPWLSTDELLLPTKLGEETTYDIIEIHDALERFDKKAYVEKYPKPGPRYKEMKELIDKRRIDVNRECEEATADPDARRQYSWIVAQRRVRDCFAGNFADDADLLQSERFGYDVYEPYSIIDIYDAVVRYNEPSNVPSYPREWYGDLSEREGKDMDKRRGAIEKEYEQALSSPDCKDVKEYTKGEAELRVRDCYFCPFPEGEDILPIKKDGNRLITFTIFDIHEAIQCYDEKKRLQKYPEDGGPGLGELKKLIEENIAGVKKEYEEAKLKLRRYSPDEAEQRVRDCFLNSLDEEETIFSLKNVEMRIQRVQDLKQTYDIFDIHKMYLHFQEMSRIKGRPQCVRVSRDLIKSVREKIDALEEEYQQSKRRLGGCSWSEATRRVRDCFAHTFIGDTDVFPTKEEENGIPKTQQTYDIFDIKKAVDYFDLKVLREKYLDEKQPDSKEKNSRVDEKRANIEEEYEEATKKVEIEHGSGFIVHDHFIITNKHVVEDVVCDNTMKIGISNAAIGELPCEVAHYDAGKDLALLYCQELNLKQSGIFPLQFSDQPLLPGMQIFAFGFPMSHTEETALFINGNVSGSKKTFSGDTMTVLNCSLNSGNSGGPILCWVIGQLKVVGVARQKHFKEILTLEERGEIERIRKRLQTSSIAKSKYLWQYQQVESDETKMNLLTLKLYDALETHSQFNLSNAVPGHCVIDFIKDSISKYQGESKEELAEIVESSKEHSSVLPAGHHSASKCCVQ